MILQKGKLSFPQKFTILALNLHRPEGAGRIETEDEWLII